MTKLEEVARALWNAASVRAAGRPRLTEWADESEETREQWRHSARAALQALHDLPEETAAQFGCYFNSDTSDGHPWDVQALWEDVIDALLAEKDDTATRQ